MSGHCARNTRLAGLAAWAIMMAAAPGSGAEGSRSIVTVESCTTCHGPGGLSRGEIPTIAGLDVHDLSKALTEFRDGSRTGTIMGRLVGALSDDDIAAISEYFATIGETGK
jgi:sulfide dehydrogenase cytochrome subunit